LNKSDLVDPQRHDDAGNWWRKRVDFTDTLAISAQKNLDADAVRQMIIRYLPENPPYYPIDQLTDRPERFFVAEIIREKIFFLYSDEIPYCCEVSIDSFQDSTTNAGVAIARIQASIIVMRETQKAIILGRNGDSIKKLGTQARMDIERFIQTKVFLELTVKVKDNWRDDERALTRMGYV
jgi:GTP-binding protein Era